MQLLLCSIHDGRASVVNRMYHATSASDNWKTQLPAVGEDEHWGRTLPFFMACSQQFLLKEVNPRTSSERSFMCTWIWLRILDLNYYISTSSVKTYSPPAQQRQEQGSSNLLKPRITGRQYWHHPVCRTNSWTTRVLGSCIASLLELLPILKQNNIAGQVEAANHVASWSKGWLER